MISSGPWTGFSDDRTPSTSRFLWASVLLEAFLMPNVPHYPTALGTEDRRPVDEGLCLTLSTWVRGPVFAMVVKDTSFRAWVDEPVTAGPLSVPVRIPQSDLLKWSLGLILTSWNFVSEILLVNIWVAVHYFINVIVRKWKGWASGSQGFSGFHNPISRALEPLTLASRWTLASRNPLQTSVLFKFLAHVCALSFTLFTT